MLSMASGGQGGLFILLHYFGVLRLAEMQNSY